MKKILWVIAWVFVASSLTGCCCCCCSPGRGPSSRIIRNINAGPVQRIERDIELQDAEQVDVTISFDGGDLEIDSVEQGLLNGVFVFNVDELAPVIEYEVENGRGRLLVGSESDEFALDLQVKEIRNEWQLGLAKNVPLNLTIDVGASRGELKLGGLTITELELTVGAAELEVSFNELNPGKMERMFVHSGAARLALVDLGNANVTELVFDGGVGSYRFDFHGDWQRSAEVKIKSGVSNIVLQLPQDIGVRVCPGDLDGGSFGNLHPQETCYVNDAYTASEIKLEIDLDVGLSTVKVK